MFTLKNLARKGLISLVKEATGVFSIMLYYTATYQESSVACFSICIILDHNVQRSAWDPVEILSVPGGPHIDPVAFTVLDTPL